MLLGADNEEHVRRQASLSINPISLLIRGLLLSGPSETRPRRLWFDFIYFPFVLCQSGGWGGGGGGGLLERGGPCIDKQHT